MCAIWMKKLEISKANIGGIRILTARNRAYTIVKSIITVTGTPTIKINQQIIYIVKEGQTKHWSKEKGQNDKQQSTKHT